MKNVCHGWTLHILSLAKKFEKKCLFFITCAFKLPSNSSCFVYTHVFQVRARGFGPFCSQLEIYGKVLNLCRQCLLSGHSIGLLSTCKLNTVCTRTAPILLYQDLKAAICHAVKTFWLNDIILHIYINSYNTFHMKAAIFPLLKKILQYSFIVVGGVIAFYGPREWNFTILGLNSL